ncbi:Serine/threonine-protein kinase plk1 [Linnemannia hyalina]|uniref:Serine/threonine-protein kinase plk1 n=1 Tax=Linnemannia hyalina TaxID=64524 RepID=A0A9P8BPF8_9FUNG|nr:Serine/threonine-protein kinase plk1 [Linnemannia hyalina]
MNGNMRPTTTPVLTIHILNSKTSPSTNSDDSLAISNGNNTPGLNSNASPDFNGFGSPILNSDGPLVFDSDSTVIVGSGNPVIVSIDSLPVGSNESHVFPGNSSENPPIIITPPTDSLLLPELSDHIQSLARSVTPTRRLLSNSPVPIVRTPGGSGWKLNEPSRHSNKGKAKETKESEEPHSYFVDQVTGERYKKDDTLGEGGFGVVYKVVGNDGKAYALKTFKNDGSGRNFQYEINMLDAAGKHDNLIEYFGVVNDPSGKYPLFELCRPLDLFDLIRNRGRLTYPEVRYFGLGIAAGIAHLHEKKVIHCDLKPENVFITLDMQVRVGDLGLAERYDPRGRVKGRVGTNNFIAPEVVNGKPHTYEMDTFSFGCIMYMMLLGSRPYITTLSHVFPNQLENVLLENEASKDPNRKLTPDAQALLRTLLSFDPTARPKPSRMDRQTFFAMGHCPTKLDESVFYTPYIPVGETKRKDAPVEEEEETRAVKKAKYEYDDLEDPYVDFDL